MKFSLFIVSLLAVALAGAIGMFSTSSQPAEAASPCAVVTTPPVHILDECFDLFAVDSDPENTGSGDVDGIDDRDGWDGAGNGDVVNSNNVDAWTEVEDGGTTDCRIRREELQIRDECVITYGPIDVEGYTDLDLAYLYGLVRLSGSGAQTAYVEYSTNGSTFLPLANYPIGENEVTDCEDTGGRDTDCADNAATHDLAIEDTCETPDLWIRFSTPTSTGLDTRFVIDDVSVTGTSVGCEWPTIPFTIEKDCGDLTSDPIFTFTVSGLYGDGGVNSYTPDPVTIACDGFALFNLPIQANITVVETVPDGWELTPLAGPPFGAGDCETTSGTPNVRFHYELFGEAIDGYQPGDPDPAAVEDGVRIEVPAEGAINTQAVTCTFYNEPIADFEKYTEPYDEYVTPGEIFSWFIQVPNVSDPWTLWDWLPSEFSVEGPIVEPDGVDCSVYGGQTIMCTGSTDETVIIEIPVSAKSRACGEYTNRAKLITGVIAPASVQSVDGEYASDSVEVVDCRRTSSRTWLAGFQWRRGLR